MAEAGPLVELLDVRKHYAVRGGLFEGRAGLVRAVDGVSLSIARGETLGLVGESGCGKSTLGRLLVALEPPSAGEVRFHGRPLPARPPKSFRRQVQMIFQDPYSSLNPRKSVGAIVGEGLAIHGVGSRAGQRERVLELLGLVGLRPEHARRYPHEFSGGQRQRVAIARSLALNPELVICDEPVSALDVSIQAQVLNLLYDLQQRLGLTYLFISHDLAVVSTLADRVAVMYRGRLVELAPREAIYGSPRHPYTRALMAAVPIPDPEAAARKRAHLKDNAPVPAAEACPFAPRCPEAEPGCEDESPALTEVAPGHFVACRKP
jgi:oligopeptide/dipeptide ABC transporter ATP-binding protein